MRSKNPECRSDEQFRHRHYSIERGAQLVADVGKEIRPELGRFERQIAGASHITFELFALGHVAPNNYQAALATYFDRHTAGLSATNLSFAGSEFDFNSALRGRVPQEIVVDTAIFEKTDLEGVLANDFHRTEANLASEGRIDGYESTAAG